MSCFGDETRQRAERGGAMMALAALRPMLMPRCQACRVSALPHPVASRRIVQGQPVSASTALLGVRGVGGLGSTLSGHVMVRQLRASFVRGVSCRHGNPNLALATG